MAPATNLISFAFCMLFCCMQLYSPVSATTSATPPQESTLNLTQFTSGDVDKLGVICQVAEQIELVAAMNVSDFSIQKQIQLQAMQITGAQVKENICDWISAVFSYSEILEDDSCVDQELTGVCNAVKMYASNAQS